MVRVRLERLQHLGFSGSVELQLAFADAHRTGKAFQEAFFAEGERAIMFYVDDVQKEADRLTAVGAEFTQPPTKVTGSTIAPERHGRQPRPAHDPRPPPLADWGAIRVRGASENNLRDVDGCGVEERVAG